MRRWFLSSFIMAFLLLQYGLIAALIYVPDDFKTIQEAVNAASDGDLVIVRSGTFLDNIDFSGKAVTIESESGPAATIIDGNRTGCVVTFHTGEGAGSVLRGFTVTNGSSPGAGGGIFCGGSSPEVSDCIITGNSALWNGGGIYSSSGAVFTGCRIEANSAGYNGGGAYCSSRTTISHCTVDGNSATFDGGGIYCGWNSTATIEANTISGNSAGYGGGGIFCLQATPDIRDNIISSNEAEAGGGIHLYLSSPLLVNNTIAGNSAVASTWWGGGGGVFCDDCSPNLTNNTITKNTAVNYGGGFACWRLSSPIIVNSILWDNSAPAGPEIWIGNDSDPSTLSILHSDVKGGQASVHVEPGCTLDWGNGMIDADPELSEAGAGDFHLLSSSPCRNAGTSYGLLPDRDFEGDPRSARGLVDMGADEFYHHLYHTGSVIPGGALDIRIVGKPGTAPVTLVLGSGVKDQPSMTMYGLLFLEPPFKQYALPRIPAQGILVIPVQIPVWVSPGSELPLQALLGPFTAGSLLTNLLVLAVE